MRRRFRLGPFSGPLIEDASERVIPTRNEVFIRINNKLQVSLFLRSLDGHSVLFIFGGLQRGLSIAHVRSIAGEPVPEGLKRPDTEEPGGALLLGGQQDVTFRLREKRASQRILDSFKIGGRHMPPKQTRSFE